MNKPSLESSLATLRRSALLAIIRREGRSIADARLDGALLSKKFSEAIETIRSDTHWYLSGWQTLRSWLSWPQR